MKYRITMKNHAGIYLREVEGEPFTIPEYPELQLATRKVSPDSAYDVSFTVDEITTGYQIGGIYLGLNYAIDDIKKRVERKGGIYKVLEMIKTTRAEIEAKW